MCVIAVCKKRQLTKEEFDNCFWSNDDGAGIAFRKDGEIHYIKGLMNKDSAWELYHKLDLKDEHVVHFRIGTSGSKSEALTHPFIIDKKSPIKLKYAGKKPILFHNGVIRDWKEWEMPYYITQGFIPDGEMSDSRLGAMLVATLGVKAIDKMDGKFIIMTTDKILSWGDFTEENGVYFSNSSYKRYGYGKRYSSFENDFMWTDYGKRGQTKYEKSTYSNAHNVIEYDKKGNKRSFLIEDNMDTSTYSSDEWDTFYKYGTRPKKKTEVTRGKYFGRWGL